MVSEWVRCGKGRERNEREEMRSEKVWVTHEVMAMSCSEA